MSRRHPVVDPRTGDRIQNKGQLRRVTRVDQHLKVVEFNYSIPGRDGEAAMRCKHSCWVKWAQGGTVLSSPGWTG